MSFPVIMFIAIPSILLGVIISSTIFSIIVTNCESMQNKLVYSKNAGAAMLCDYLSIDAEAIRKRNSKARSSQTVGQRRISNRQEFVHKASKRA